MKMTLLGTAAALCLFTGPALAGPALDTFTGLMFDGAETRHASERVEGDAEIYESLEITAGGNLWRFDQVRFRLTENAVALSGTGMRLTARDGAVVGVGELDLSIPMAFEAMPTDALKFGEGGVRISPDLCGALRTPLQVQIAGLTLQDGITVESLGLETSVSGPEAACLLDLMQEMSGFTLTDPSGLGIRIASQQIKVKTPVTPGLPEVATGETWVSELTLSGAEVLVNGTVELRLDRLEGEVRLIGDTLLPLAAAGHTRALARAIATAQAPEEQLPWADLWNALREVVGDGRLQMTGLAVTGSELAKLVDVMGPLDAGSRLDLTGEVIKNTTGLQGAFTLDGSATALIGLDLALSTGPADPSFNTLPPSALLTGAPIGLAGAGLRLSDRGAGALIERAVGMNPYTLLEAVLPGWVGAEKAALVMGWMGSVRDGGSASLRVTPAEPVPLLTIGMMALGDWALLGTMLNVSTVSR